MTESGAPYPADRGQAGEVIAAVVLCLAIVFALLGPYAKSFGDPATSRLATVLALTEHGTFYIDGVEGEPNKFEQRTIDKVVVDGRKLSSKPPMLPLFMTAEYVVLRAITGWDLKDEDEKDLILRWMTLVLIGGSYILCVVFFWKTTAFFADDAFVRALMLFAVAFCTQLWGYAININNHVPGVGMLMVSLYFALGMLTGNRPVTWWRLLLFGVTGGLTFTFDMPATVFVFLAGLGLLAKWPVKAVIWAGIGVAIPVVPHFAIMIATTGSPLPVQMNQDLYLSETSYWRHPLGVDALNETRGQYIFHMTLGRSGLFSLYPILLAGMAGAMTALVKHGTRWRAGVFAGFAGFLIMGAYYGLRTDNYGGESYGFRWFIPAMPVLMLMGAPVLTSLRKRWQWVFIGLMLAVSFYSAWESTVNPWRANQEWTTRFLGDTYTW